MLTPQQIQIIQSTKSPTGSAAGGISPSQSQPMNDEQFSQWSSGSSNPSPPYSSTNNPVGDFVSSIPSSVASLADTTGKNMYDQQKKSFNNIGSDVQNGANDIEQAGIDLENGNVGSALWNTGKTVVQGGLGTVSDAIQYFLSPLTSAIKTGVDTVSGNNPNAQGISDIPAVQNLATGPVGNELQTAQTYLSKAAQANPVLAKALTDAFTVATTAVGGSRAPEALDQLGSGASKDFSTMSDTASSVSNKISKATQPIINKTGNVISGISEKVGNVIDKMNPLSGKPATIQDALDMTKETLNKKGSISAIENAGKPGGAVKSGAMGTIDTTPNAVDTRIANTVLPQVVKGKPIDTIANINQEISRVSEGEIKPFLQKNPSPFNTKTLNSYIKSNTELPDFIKADPVLQKTYDLARQRMLDISSKGKMDMNGLWDARKEFDSVANKQIGNLDPQSEKVSAIKQAVLDTRRAVNNFISENTPNGDANFKGKLQNLNDMYEARSRIAESNYKSIGTTGLQRWIKNNPLKYKALMLGGGFLIGDKALKGLTGLGI